MTEPRHAASPVRRTAPGRPPVPAAVLAILTFGLLVLLASASAIDWTVSSRFDILGGAVSYTPTPMPPPSDAGLEPPEVTPLGWTGPAFVVMLIVLGAILLVLLARRLWRARPRRRVQVLSSTPVAPFITVSMGKLTNVSTSSGASPSASEKIVTVGRFRSGKTSTGSFVRM